MNCIIVEDQPPAQRILKKYIEDMGTLTLKGTFSDAIQAMEFLRREPVDLIFLDIHLPKISGIDFLKTLTNPPHVILTTAFPDYALESYEFKVQDYLLKPFTFQRFVKAVSRIPQNVEYATSPSHHPQGRQQIYIKSGHEHVKVNIEDIIYIKSDADYSEIHVDNKRLLSAESLRHWLETLKNDDFLRVHKSYVVNSAKIEKIAGNQVFLVNKEVIPIGRAYKENFLQQVMR